MDSDMQVFLVFYALLCVLVVVLGWFFFTHPGALPVGSEATPFWGI